MVTGNVIAGRVYTLPELLCTIKCGFIFFRGHTETVTTAYDVSTVNHKVGIKRIELFNQLFIERETVFFVAGVRLRSSGARLNTDECP